MHWVLERGIFSSDDEAFISAVRTAGHGLTIWDDDWWSTGRWPELTGQAVVFRGSLGNAVRVRQELPWQPGAFCDVDAYHCSAWYPRVTPHLVHANWRLTTVSELVERGRVLASEMGDVSRLFVRPDSPLKPFSGRVVDVDRISLEALDHGFYYDDKELPVIIAPVRDLGHEFRFVAVAGQLVAGSGYHAEGRTSHEPIDSRHPAWSYAAGIVSEVETPEVVCVLDIVESEDGYRILEFNPFSGADIYSCAPMPVIQSLEDYAANQGW